ISEARQALYKEIVQFTVQKFPRRSDKVATLLEKATKRKFVGSQRRMGADLEGTINKKLAKKDRPKALRTLRGAFPKSSSRKDSSSDSSSSESIEPTPRGP